MSQKLHPVDPLWVMLGIFLSSLLEDYKIKRSICFDILMDN